MKYLKEKWKPLALVFLAIVANYGYAYMETFSNAYGLFSPTDSNQDLITFNCKPILMRCSFFEPQLEHPTMKDLEANSFRVKTKKKQLQNMTPAKLEKAKIGRLFKIATKKDRKARNAETMKRLSEDLPALHPERALMKKIADESVCPFCKQ